MMSKERRGQKTERRQIDYRKGREKKEEEMIA